MENKGYVLLTALRRSSLLTSLLIIYVIGAIVVFVGFAIYFNSKGVSIGALPITAFLWPIFLPLVILWILMMGTLYVLGGGGKYRRM